MSAHHPQPRVGTRWSLSLLCLALLALAGNALAGSLNLAWDGVVGASGYRLAYGTASGSYSASLDAGNQTTATVPGLTDGVRYYFAVQAYNATATSAYSNEVSAVVPAGAPVAAFRASSLTGTAPLTVNFTDRSTGSITAWSWSFGTGATSTAPSASYTYTSAGNYRVSLTVTGPGGSATISKVVSLIPSDWVSTTGLVAAYGFDEVSGNQVLDASGLGNHGTHANATRTDQGKFGRALAFNGTNSLVTVNDSKSLDLTEALTLSAWVYPTAVASGWKTLIWKERSGGLTYALRIDSERSRALTTLRIGTANQPLEATGALPLNTWTHLAATYDGAYQRLFINANPVGSRPQTGPLEVSTNPLRIGGNTVLAGQFFQGRIDEVRVYRRRLSKGEIAAVGQEPVAEAARAAEAAPASVCATACSLWDEATTPTLVASTDPNPIEVGLKFRSSHDGQVTGVRFYKGAGNTGTHVGRLWTSSGQLLAEATFTDESASGWQQVNFDSPVSIQADTLYVVSYYAPRGRYAYDKGYFYSAYSNDPLEAPASSEVAGNGVSRYGAGGGFPSTSDRSANYWVDPVLRTP